MKGGVDLNGECWFGQSCGFSPALQERLAVRNFMDELRSSGADTGGPAPLTQSDRQAFGNQLDRFLVRHATRPNATTGKGPQA